MKALADVDIVGFEIAITRKQNAVARLCEPASADECSDERHVKCVQIAALVMVFVDSWCLVDTYLNRQRQLVLENSS